MFVCTVSSGIVELAHHVGATNIEEKIWTWLCPDSNHGPLARRANALPLSYTGSLPNCYVILYELESVFTTHIVFKCESLHLYVLCCSVNGSVCFMCCVFDSVCELVDETIRNMFGCGCYFVVECYGSV